ncbi:MAG: hypothetical protein MJZ09_05400 [Bacteroidales bacterium]|nr:hypothetical protein [Bacteroidales bacterium]
MTVFLSAAVVLIIAVFGMCFNIIFRKDGKFPEYEVSSNKEMRKLGIRCMREQDDAIFGSDRDRKHDICTGDFDESCKGCSLYKQS